MPSACLFPTDMDSCSRTTFPTGLEQFNAILSARMTGWLCTAEPCNLQGTCQTNNTCFCDNDYTSCGDRDSSNGCETQTGSDINKCALPHHGAGAL